MSGNCPICGNFGDDCCCDTLRLERGEVYIKAIKNGYLISSDEFRGGQRTINENFYCADMEQVTEKLKELFYVGGWK